MGRSNKIWIGTSCRLFPLTCDDSPCVQLHADDVSLVGLELAIVADLHSARPVDDAHVPEVHVAAKVAGRQDVTCADHMYRNDINKYGGVAEII